MTKYQAGITKSTCYDKRITKHCSRAKVFCCKGPQCLSTCSHVHVGADTNSQSLHELLVAV